jgi:hypothetical protein
MPHRDPDAPEKIPDAPVSLKVRFLSSVLQSVEWAARGGKCCPTCGSNHDSGHATGCPVALALFPGRDRDLLDDAITDTVFLVASLRASIWIPLDAFTRELEDIEAIVTRIQALMPTR